MPQPHKLLTESLATQVLHCYKDGIPLSSNSRELVAYQRVDLYAKENRFCKNVYVDVGSEVSQASYSLPWKLLSLVHNSRLRFPTLSRVKLFTHCKTNTSRLWRRQTPGTVSPNDLERR